jgi:hypothetical protein
MPWPKTIKWEKRLSVFLAYRRNGGKVNPVANRYGIARSTVNVIVKEFVYLISGRLPVSQAVESGSSSLALWGTEKVDQCFYHGGP